MGVRVVQYILAVIAYFDNQIPVPIIDGVFDQNTKDAVLAFQRQYGLPATGIVDRDTWNRMNTAYADTIANIPPDVVPDSAFVYPGRFLTLGMTGDDVEDLQRLLAQAAALHDFIPAVTVTGDFDDATENAVRAVQQQAGLEANGAVGPLTWARIVELAQDA